MRHDTMSGDTEARKRLWAGRLWLFGLATLFPAYALWMGRYFLASLASTRAVATAAVSVEKGPNEVQLQRAFAAAKMRVPVEVTLEPQTHPSLPGAYTLSVTADSENRAKAGIAEFAKALTAEFPNAERNLYLSLNYGSLPAPNDATRHIFIGVIAAIVILMLAGQLMLVAGARMEGGGRAGIIAAIATPFMLLVFPTSSGTRRYSRTMTVTADWHFVVLLLALTPLAVLLGLWLTRAQSKAYHARR